MDANQKIKIRILEASRALNNKLGAIAATGFIVLHAEDLPDPELREHFDRLNVFLEHSEITASHYFAGTMLFNLICEIEVFFSTVIRIVLESHPKKIGSTQFNLSEVLEKSHSELVSEAADKYLNSLMYKKPLEYLDELCKTLSIERSSIAPLWPAYVEGKARRDLGTHNNWIVNKTYQRKVEECGLQTNLKIGDRACPDQPYIYDFYEHCEKLMKELRTSLANKFAIAGMPA